MHGAAPRRTQEKRGVVGTRYYTAFYAKVRSIFVFEKIKPNTPNRKWIPGSQASDRGRSYQALIRGGSNGRCF